jgi:hypothetical protein
MVKKKTFLLGMLVLALSFGLAMAGCELYDCPEDGECKNNYHTGPLISCHRKSCRVYSTANASCDCD